MCSSDLINRVFELLVTAYTQPNRYYHNLNHIDRLLTTVAQFNHQLQAPMTVELAVWFHDYIYNSQASDNEAQSAKAARVLLISIGESTATIDRVQQLILATQGHQIDANDVDMCIFLDADLAILGADPAAYQAYQQAIRQEYSWVSDSAYQIGRIQVLESFLRRDRLYYTEVLFDRLESIARSNMQGEISQLR